MAKSEYVRGYFVGIVERDVTHSALRFRAELWWNPYDGHLCASTRWVATRGQAVRDAEKFLMRKEGFQGVPETPETVKKP